MNRLTVSLTPDEFANVQTAMEHFLDYLDDHGRRDYPAEDIEEITASCRSALEALYVAGFHFFEGGKE